MLEPRVGIQLGLCWLDSWVVFLCRLVCTKPPTPGPKPRGKKREGCKAMSSLFMVRVACD